MTCRPFADGRVSAPIVGFRRSVQPKRGFWRLSRGNRRLGGLLAEGFDAAVVHGRVTVAEGLLLTATHVGGARPTLTITNEARI
jgi:hypothetical protein